MADTTTSGLDAIPAEEPTTVGVAKPVAAKGPYALGTPIGATGYDPELLTNMQKLIEEKQAQREGFQERMKDATAWWSGGVAGPAEALQNRAAERDRQQAELFGMKSQISQAKMGQAQLDQLRKQDAASGWGTPGTTAPTSGGAAPAAGAIPADIVKQYNTILGTEGVAAANKFKNAVLQQGFKSQAEFQNNPAAYNLSVEYKVQDPNTGAWSIEKMSPIDAQRRGVSEAQRVSPPAAGSAQGPGGAPAISAGLPVISATRSPAQGQALYDQSQVPGYIGNPVAKPGTSAHETGNAIDVDMKKATPEHLQWLQQNGYTQPLPLKDPNHWQKSAAPAQTQLTAPGAPPAHPSTFAAPAPTISNIQQQQAVQQAGATSQATESGKLYAAGENELRTQGLNAGSRQVTQNSTMKLLDDPQLQDMVGKYQTGSKADAFVRQMQAGIEAGNFGSIGLKELQANLAKTGASPEAIRKFDTLQNNLIQNQAEWTRNYLKGQGSVSDNERSMVQKVVGSTDDPVGKLKVITGTLRERALFDAEVYNAYKGNKGASFSEFLDSPQYQTLNDKHNNRLANILDMDPKDLKANDGFKIQNNVATPSATNWDAAKEARYQNFKASQSKAK